MKKYHVLSVLLLLCVLLPSQGFARQIAIGATVADPVAVPEKTGKKAVEKKPAAAKADKTVDKTKTAKAQPEKTKPEKTKVGDKKKKLRLQDTLPCQTLGQEIRDSIHKLGRCWKDLDCSTVALGCPWQLAPCSQTVISLAEPEKNDALNDKIKQYTKICVTPDAPYAASCKKFDKVIQGSHCQAMMTMCVSGRCMSQLDVILQDPDLGKKFEKGSVLPENMLRKTPDFVNDRP